MKKTIVIDQMVRYGDDLFVSLVFYFALENLPLISRRTSVIARGNRETAQPSDGEGPTPTVGHEFVSLVCHISIPRFPENIMPMFTCTYAHGSPKPAFND